MLIIRSFLLTLCAVTLVSAAQVEATPAVPAKSEPAKVEPAKSIGYVSEEEKWIFDPPAARIDAFADIEQRLTLELDSASPTTPGGTAGPTLPLDNGQAKVDAAIEWGIKEAERVDSLSLVRKWSETIAACDNAINTLKKYESNTPVSDLIERFKRYRTQAEEAKIYEEAQAKFDALGIKVEGILWSQEGSLAVIGGEPRALKIHDKVKDCTIINIDTNRVDFLFFHEKNRRRYEFQRYVGEVVNASRAH